MLTCDVVGDNRENGILDEFWDQAMEALLACGIPELELHANPIVSHFFHDKIYSYGRLWRLGVKGIH